MNVILIVSDTLRRDHLGCYGNPWIETPHIDRLSERSTTFERCYAGSFPTIPMRADLFTGKYTFAYMGWEPLGSDEVTLAQAMTEGGYQTFGVTDTPFLVRRGYGYDRGFLDFEWVRGQNPGLERDDVTHGWRYEEDRFAAVTMATAEKWLEHHHTEDFFLYVDTWDPHEPWDPPAYYVERYAEGGDVEESVFPCYWDWKEAGLTEEEVKMAHASYCGEVTMVDRWVGRLLERVESLGLMDETAILFTSDHGFAFGEHGLLGKSRLRNDFGFMVESIGNDATGGFIHLYRSPETGEVVPFSEPGDWYRCPLYDELVRVPLLVYHPDMAPGRSDALVSIPDLMPTMLELAKAEIPNSVQGCSMVPLLDGRSGRVHDFVVSTMPLYPPGEEIRIVDDLVRGLRELSPSTITTEEWSLMYAVSGEPIELYHKPSDPRQETNVFHEHQDVAEQIHHMFVRFLEDLGTEEERIAARRDFP